uniref:Uncharacterized protein n=1 Tax=Amphimedon queenslandica TaxID=400682 RepID=A0A1X7VG79_AMPQE
MRKSGPQELRTKLARFLLHYRTTRQATTGSTLAELLMGCSLRTHLYIMRPNITYRVENKQLSQKKHYDSRAKERSLLPQDVVNVRSSGPSSSWIAGKIEARLGNVHYDVMLDDG